MSDPPKKGPDFSRPIEALKACHARIRSECGTLRKLAEHLKDRGATSRPARRRRTSCQFDTAPRTHTTRRRAAAAHDGGGDLSRAPSSRAWWPTRHRHREMDRTGPSCASCCRNLPEKILRLSPQVDRFANLTPRTSRRRSNSSRRRSCFRRTLRRIGSSRPTARRRALLTARPAPFISRYAIRSPRRCWRGP